MARYSHRHSRSSFANGQESHQSRRHRRRLSPRENRTSTVGGEPLTSLDSVISRSGWKNTAMIRDATLDPENLLHHTPDPAMLSDCSVLYDNNLYDHIQTRGPFEQLEWDASLADCHISIRLSLSASMSADAMPSANSVPTALLDDANDWCESTASSEHQSDRSWAVPIHPGPADGANDPTGYASQRLPILAHQGWNPRFPGSSRNKDAAADNIERRDSSGSSADGTSVDHHDYVDRCISIDQDDPWSSQHLRHIPDNHYPSGSQYEMNDEDEDDEHDVGL